MKKPSITLVKKYLSSIAKIRGKYITPEKLSREVGIYPDVIQDNLSYFDPMLKMDPDYNLLELVPEMKKYVIEQEEKKIFTPKKEIVTKRTIEEYESIGDFVYQKMTIAGGIINKNTELSNTDLKILKRLISEEQAKRKK